MVYGQTWETYQKLYSDQNIQVEISFKTSPSACNPQGQASRYKYRIKGKLYPIEKYVQWDMEYMDCNGIRYIETNSVNIGKSGFVGIVESMDYSYLSTDRISNFKEVRLSSKEEKKKQEYREIITVMSQQIHGDRWIYKGQSTVLSAKSGTLGTGSQWEWYEGDCDGKFLGRGETISVQPQENTKYYLKAVDAKSVSECISVEVQIDIRSRMPHEIGGSPVVCIGESVELRADGGVLGDNTEWVWYEGNCDGQEIGRSAIIKVRPQQRTAYYLKAVGENGSEDCLRKVIFVESPSSAPLDIVMETSDKICQGEMARLRVTGGQLGMGAQWTWYKNEIDSKNRLGSGELLSNRPNENIEYLVRAEGYCNTTKYVAQAVKVTPKPLEASDIKVTDNVVYKNQKTTFSVVNRTRNEKNYSWKWALDDHRSAIVGEGTEVSLKLKSPTSIIVYNESECGTSAYFKKTFIPVKGKQLNQNFSSHKKFQFNWFVGPHVLLRFPRMTDDLNIGLGGNFGWNFYPLFKKYYSVGISAQVSTGTYLNSKVTSEKVSGNYYISYQPTIELAAGAKGAKVLFAYSHRNQIEKYSVKTEDATSLEHSYRQHQMSAGFRFGAVDRKDGIIFFDMAYLATKNIYGENISLADDFQKKSNWRHGWTTSISVHNAVKIDATMIFDDVNALYHQHSYSLGIHYYFNRYY